MDGYELARRLRDICPDVRLIALTGYGQASDHDAALAAGFDAHCAKPVTISTLLGLIDERTGVQPPAGVAAVAELKFRAANVGSRFRRPHRPEPTIRSGRAV